jgi:uncharacterized protein
VQSNFMSNQTSFLGQSSRGQNSIVKYILGFFLVLVGYFLGQIPMEVIKEIQIGRHPELGVADEALFLETMDFSILHIDKNVGLLLLLMMFIFAMITLYFVVSYLHKKEFLDIVTTRRPLDRSRVMYGFGVWMLLLLIAEMLQYAMMPENYTLVFDANRWLPLVLICIFVLPIQTSLEELLLRGYVMQGVYEYVRKPWVAITLSTILFALMHGTNPEVAKYGMVTMFSYYVLAGAFLAYITVMDQGLELALGVHWATNFGGAVLLTYEGSVMQTDSIFRVTTMNPYLLIILFVVSAIIFAFMASRRYGWRSFDPLLH